MKKKLVGEWGGRNEKGEREVGGKKKVWDLWRGGTGARFTVAALHKAKMGDRDWRGDNGFKKRT